MDKGNTELSRYFFKFVRWWWLFILLSVSAGSAAYFVTARATPIFQSSAQIVVERQGKPGIPSADDFTDSAILAQNYADLIIRKPVLEQISQKLPVVYFPNNLRSKLTVTSRRNIIRITASDNDPTLAAIIANTAAETFIQFQLERQLSQLAQFQEVLSQYGIQQDSEIVAAQAATLGILSIIEPAVRSPSSLTGQDITRKVLIAVLVAMIFSATIVVATEYFDTRIRSIGELKEVAGIDFVGSIPRIKRIKAVGLVGTAKDSTGHGVAESFDTLRTIIEFSSCKINGNKTVLVTSPRMKEGKTLTSLNLAASLARENKSTILLDSDLRSSSLHLHFGIDIGKGLTDVISGEATTDEALKTTSINGLKVVTSGSSPCNPVELFRSDGFNEFLQDLKSRAQYVILDGPPLVAVSDGLILASITDGTMLVVNSHTTSRDSVIEAMSRLKLVNPAPSFMNVVLNQAGSSREDKRYFKHIRNF